MTDGFHDDDMARLLALEHAFSALALISASNFSYLAKCKPSEAIAQFRTAIEGSIFDSGNTPRGIREAIRAHLKRMFDHLETMAKHADEGAQEPGGV